MSDKFEFPVPAPATCMPCRCDDNETMTRGTAYLGGLIDERLGRFGRGDHIVAALCAFHKQVYAESLALLQ